MKLILFLATTFVALSAALPARAEMPSAAWPISKSDIRFAKTDDLANKVYAKVSGDALKRAAEQGDPMAMNLYGHALQTGRDGLPKSPRTGYEWIRKSCDIHKSARGCVNKALALLDGVGVTRDTAAAKQILTSTCDTTGLPYACRLAGNVLAGDAKTDPKVLDSAVKYWKRACNMDDTPNADPAACTTLGSLYEHGAGAIKVNLDTAWHYYYLGCFHDADDHLGNGTACLKTGELVASQKVEPKLDGKRARPIPIILSAYTKGCEWLGNSGACYNMAVDYALGNYGMTPNPKEAFALLEKSCGMGNDVACYEQGSWLALGRGVKADSKAAIKLLSPLCLREKNPSMLACHNAAMAAVEGKGMPGPDYATARKLFSRACYTGNMYKACLGLTALYQKDRGGKTTTAEAKRLAQTLCKLGPGKNCKDADEVDH